MYNTSLRMGSATALDNTDGELRTRHEPERRPSDNAEAGWCVPPPSQAEPEDWKRAAEQIALEASRLQGIALAHNQQFLAYLIEMVVLEAWREASREPSSDQGGQTPGQSVSP